MMQYKVIPFKTGCMSGTINQAQLQNVLNTHANEGWKLSRTINESTGIFIRRNAHFLIFERPVQ